MMRVVSIAGLLVMAGGVAGLLRSRTLLSASPLVVVVQVAAAALMVWARITFGRRSFHATADPTEGGLVTTGPYHFVRHPIYTAVCLFCWAGVLAHASIMTAAFGCLVVTGAFMRMLREERLLVQRYPEYRQYALVTKRMVPYVF
jgi:protein-S-isoprenylcysteine O-methyltransferase Ste14